MNKIDLGLTLVVVVVVAEMVRQEMQLKWKSVGKGMKVRSEVVLRRRWIPTETFLSVYLYVYVYVCVEIEWFNGYLFGFCGG